MVMGNALCNSFTQIFMSSKEVYYKHINHTGTPNFTPPKPGYWPSAVELSHNWFWYVKAMRSHHFGDGVIVFG